jgi:type II secretory pathway component PulJ
MRKQIYNLQFTIYKYRKGFTIVELLIYMALLSGFLIVMTELFASIMDVKLESNAVSSVEQDGRYILTRLAYDIPRSSAITTPSTLGSTTGSLVMVISGVTYTYSVVNGNLEITNNLGTNNLNSSESIISNVSFRKIGNAGGKETIKLNFDITSATVRNAGPEVRTFSTTIGRR